MQAECRRGSFNHIFINSGYSELSSEATILRNGITKSLSTPDLMNARAQVAGSLTMYAILSATLGLKRGQNNFMT